MQQHATHTFNDRVGEIRPSALLYTHGIGMVVDLQHASVMVLGIDDWPYEDTHEIVEDRLLAAVRQELGHQVRELRTPPRPVVGANDRADQRIGVPVAAFPRWLVCPYCRLLAPVKSGLFRMAPPNRYRPEEVGFIHDNCNKANKPVALPVRFVVACEKGHLDDFPWVEFVHRSTPCAHPRLALNDFGASGQAASVQVECRNCGNQRRMSDAFGDDVDNSLTACSGRLPHLRRWDEHPCDAKPRAILLGASNLWFPRVFSALAIPKGDPGIQALVEQHLDVLAPVTSEAVLAGFRLALTQQLTALAEFSDSELWEALQAIRSAGEALRDNDPVNVKTPEWEAFTSPDPDQTSNDFQLRQVVVPAAFANAIESVTLVERLREVRAFIGFNRIRAANDFGDISGELRTERLAGISAKPAEWVPAAELRGEGIFIRFREDAVRKWEDRVHGFKRIDNAHTTRKMRLINRIQIEEAANPDPALTRTVLIHSFSHVVMRALAQEAGYALASLSERIYSMSPTERDGPMAGVLIYTAASDSEGTLGGLVRLGETDRLESILGLALSDARICAADPLCAEHQMDTDNGEELHGAACHACLFAPETSCELGNAWLDRSVLVETFGLHDVEFWPNTMGSSI